jgi:hypothetical protein
MNAKIFSQYLYLPIELAIRFRTQALLLILVGFSPAQIMGDTIKLTSGLEFEGTFREAGVCGLGIRVLSNRRYHVTRCSYTGSEAGIRLNFIDSYWFNLTDALNKPDLGLSLQYCLAFTGKNLNLEVEVPSEIGSSQDDNFRRYLTELVAKQLSKRMRASKTDIFWFYMRYARIIDGDQVERYVPIGVIDKITKTDGTEISALPLFLDEQEEKTDEQFGFGGADLQRIQKNTLKAIGLLPQTADGPEWSALQYLNKNDKAKVQLLQRKVEWNTTKLIWRRRYLDILDYAR